MLRIVYYHHPQAENLSLDYVSADPREVLDRQQERDGSTKIIGYPFEEPVYVLYHGELEIESATEIDYDEDLLRDRVSSLERSGEVVVFRLVELLQAAVDANESAEFRLYKEFEPQRIQEAIENVSWESTLPRVAGELMSNLILRHSLPNANHRTGIAMLQLCIESVDPAFEMPQTHLDDDTWREWVDPYIVESKRLITVRRNNVRFERLASAGVDIVERKDGIQIVLADFELDLPIHEAQTEYAERHESHCTEFARTLLEESDRTDLLDREGPKKADFIEYLESGLVERDFRELF